MSLLEDISIVPDVDELLAVLRREKKPERVHHIELFLDAEIKDIILERYGLVSELSESDPHFHLKREIRIHEFLGYDVFRFEFLPHTVHFDMPFVDANDTTSIGGQYRGVREWTEEHAGPIQSWKDFENYKWPSVSNIDLSALEWFERNLPENMGVYDLTAHIFEMLSFLLGYETMCYKMADEPELVDAVAEKIGRYYVDYTNLLCEFDCVPLAWGSDDMGFKTATLASPEFLRKTVLPWHKACADVAHDHGKPFLIHNCGNIEAIMEDLIEDVRIDGKQSFEDAIMPVTDAYRKYGGRISILGGIDVDFLCRADEAAIRRRVHDTLDVCMEGTGYCLGTGNTVANYMPADNYLAMLDEGRRYVTGA
ncbi:MAG: uroporphyrinogen-III decarboxylase-like protein [Spirochaetes bacterium]|nr:uroporphyrinogen-III decarboxylase-like protein [Spirochaetota bacterium]